MKSTSPDNIQHSRTSGSARTNSSNARRSASAYPAQAGRRRNPDAFGQFDVGDSAVGLDFAEDFEIDLVKILRHAGPVPGLTKAADNTGNTLTPAGGLCAILLRVRCAIFGKRRGKFADMDCNSCIACQISYLGFDTFGAIATPSRAHSAQALTKFP
jgi:hypothetical protein